MKLLFFVLANFLFVATLLVSTATAATDKCCSGGRGCTGSRTCTVCKNCSGCKHCAKDGGTCGVCTVETPKGMKDSTSANPAKPKPKKK